MTNTATQKADNARAIKLAEDIVEDFDLNHNNAEVFVQDTELHIVIEAPNNTTIPVIIDLVKLPNELKNKDVYQAIVKAIDEFDPEDTFNEIYYADFSLSPFEFLEMLQEDAEFFADVAKYMEERLRELTIITACVDFLGRAQV